MIYRCLIPGKKDKKKDFFISIFSQPVSRTFSAKMQSLYRAVKLWDVNWEKNYRNFNANRTVPYRYHVQRISKSNYATSGPCMLLLLSFPKTIMMWRYRMQSDLKEIAIQISTVYNLLIPCITISICIIISSNYTWLYNFWNFSEFQHETASDLNCAFAFPPHLQSREIIIKKKTTTVMCLFHTL